MFQRGYNGFHMRSDLLFWPGLACQMLNAEVDKLLFACVGEFSVGKAPFAVFFVEIAFGIAANHRVLGERHSAALANERARRAQQRVD